MFSINWNLKKAGAILGGLLFIGIVVCLIAVFGISKYYSTSGSVYKTTAWQVPAKKVLTIKLNSNELTAGTIYNRHGVFMINTDDNDTGIHNSATLKFEQSPTDSVELIANFISRGRSHTEAYALAKRIQYNYTISDTTLTLDRYCTLGQDEAWRDQKVSLTLKIPVGTSIKLDHTLSVDDFIFDLSDVDDLNSDDYYDTIFTMTGDGLKPSASASNIK